MVADLAKAPGYIARLYDARCNGQWQDVPELARKVEKHDPSRRLLPLSSRAGARIYPHPSSLTYRAAEQEYGQSLGNELSTSAHSREDILDGSVALAAICFGIGAYDLALSRLPSSLHEVPAPDQGHGPEGWKAVCVLQGTLIRGLCYEQLGDLDAATQNYRSMIAYVSRLIELPSPCSELRKWSEELLCHICMFFSIDRPGRPAQLGEAMAGFHLLSKHLDSQGWRPLSSSVTFAKHNPRAIWRSYYQALSKIVRDDLVYHPSPVDRTKAGEVRGFLEEDDYLASRIRQRADLRRVEVNYESLLLKETAFPKAGETNTEVASWIELVMSNWRILCGPRWTNEELGSGGKLVVGRNTLDILYRAVTKTFHSTQVLRYLFTVHAYLGEFDLALKAFDAYVEIMTRGKARAERSGSAGLDLDDDETAVQLAAEAIRVSCRYGSEEAAEKTYEAGERLQSWLEKGTTQSDVKALRSTDVAEEASHELPPRSGLPPEIQYLAYSAIAVSQANYARFACDPMQRLELVEKAINNLRKYEHSQISPSTGSLYTLALALAETRDIDGALQVTRRALHHIEGMKEQVQLDGTASLEKPIKRSEIEQEFEAFDRRSRFLPIWHLMAQLLSARDDLPLAITCLSTALEHFNTNADHLSADNPSGHDRQRNMKSTSPRRLGHGRAMSTAGQPFDRLETYEKHTVIEMKMTQLSLIELTEGTEAAINASGDIFSIFTRLFGAQDLQTLRPTTRGPAGPPKSSTGTVRSLFGRHKQSSAPSTQLPSRLPTANTSAANFRPDTSLTIAPAIQVTSEHGAGADTRPATDTGSLRNKLKNKASGSIRRHASNASRRTTAPPSRTNTAPPSRRTSFEGNSGFKEADQPPPIPETEQLTTAPSRGQTLGHIPKNMASEEQPAPSGQHEQPISQDVRLPVPPPATSEFHNLSTTTSDSPHPHFHKLHEYVSTTSLLIKIWLLVARLYTTSAIFRDANLAIEEASKLAAAVESAIAQEHGASVHAFSETGWGGGKSADELNADLCNERGRLLVAQGQPHEAWASFEKALERSPDHAEATVGLCNILLDIYAQVVPIAEMEPTMNGVHANGRAINPSQPANNTAAEESIPIDTNLLHRTAARDRACALLCSLTKLPLGWDDSEAWFALARAYEESGQIENAKEALQRVVELENTRPVRKWRDVSPGGFVL